MASGLVSGSAKQDGLALEQAVLKAEVASRVENMLRSGHAVIFSFQLVKSHLQGQLFVAHSLDFGQEILRCEHVTYIQCEYGSYGQDDDHKTGRRDGAEPCFRFRALSLPRSIVVCQFAPSWKLSSVFGTGRRGGYGSA